MTGTIVLVALSPYLIAFLRRDEWPDALLTLLALIIVAICFVLGQLFDNTLSWPLPADFWSGLLAAWGSQQLLYGLALKDSPMINKLEGFGNVRPPQKEA